MTVETSRNSHHLKDILIDGGEFGESYGYISDL
jgi:hypothetical protein